ncbi:hypothetical protein FSARC_1339 [Fusarium sarcochroum]|uniref:F-box domain-containing protein n=1 Tax=Fusarium sarcochroum TaxID=1208366 RepID=A0A8H4U9L5_9HYPO|nr:hypothetical protein FSARC_1339 [Fusarium sarcochroum]
MDGPDTLRSGEISCHICGVSFNISRRRLEEEPHTASWGNIGEARIYSSVIDCTHPDCVIIEEDSYNEAGVIRYSAAQETADLSKPDIEHFPGENCQSTRAYSGRRISVEAMRGCNTYQFLQKKKNVRWIPSSDDDDLETSDDYILTDLRSHEFRSPGLFPSLNIGTPVGNTISTWTAGMPFHPTCFEIFKRASLDRYGVIDTDGLMQWWYRNMEIQSLDKFHRHAAVNRGKHYEWQHNMGDEFLAANPCFIPGLQDILDAVQDGSNFDKGPTIDLGVSAAKYNGDMFSRLPQELKLNILLDLDTWDIANLRLASRSFRQLPRLLFYYLALRELPWLYEAWTSLPLSFWATTTASEQKTLQRALKDAQSALAFNDSDEVKKECQRKVKELKEKISARPTTPVTLLDRHKTDWYRLRIELTQKWAAMPGLRNRRRIWEDCQTIMNYMDAHRIKKTDSNYVARV